jgi:hypothetical protein
MTVGDNERSVELYRAAALGVVVDVAVAKHVASRVGIMPAPDVKHEVIRTNIHFWLAPVAGVSGMIAPPFGGCQPGPRSGRAAAVCYNIGAPEGHDCC